VVSGRGRIVAIMVEHEQAKIITHVQPGASQNQVVGFKAGVLYVRIAAPPTKGKANQALVKFLSDVLSVSKSDVTIVRGMTGKMKTVVVKGLNQEQALARLEKQ